MEPQNQSASSLQSYYSLLPMQNAQRNVSARANTSEETDWAVSLIERTADFRCTQLSVDDRITLKTWPRLDRQFEYNGTRWDACVIPPAETTGRPSSKLPRHVYGLKANLELIKTKIILPREIDLEACPAIEEWETYVESYSCVIPPKAQLQYNVYPAANFYYPVIERFFTKLLTSHGFSSIRFVPKKMFHPLDGTLEEIATQFNRSKPVRLFIAPGPVALVKNLGGKHFGVGEDLVPVKFPTSRSTDGKTLDSFITRLRRNVLRPADPSVAGQFG